MTALSFQVKGVGMSENSTFGLEKRVRELERGTTRLRWGGIDLLVGVAGLALVTEAGGSGRNEEVIRANGLVVEGPNGKARIQLTVAPNGLGGMALLDEEGKCHATFLVDTGGAYVSLGPEKGGFGVSTGTRGTVGLTAKGWVLFQLCYPNGEPAFNVQTSETWGVVGPLDPKGKRKWRAPLPQPNGPGLFSDKTK